MMIGGYAIIVALTCYLVSMNVRAAVHQFSKDRNEVRLYSFLVTLLIAGSLIIGVSGTIVQRVIDSQMFLQSEVSSSPIPYYKRQ